MRDAPPADLAEATARPNAATPNAATNDRSRDADAIGQIAQDAGALTVALAEVSGHIDDIDARLTGDVATLDALRDEADQMRRANQEVTVATTRALGATTAARKQVTEGEVRLTDSLAEINRLAADVTELGQGIDQLKSALGQVGRVAADIYAIARMTNLLALNASIEAARAGSAGKGFMVVAQEVKNLSARTAEATQKIEATVGLLSESTADLARRSGGAVSRAATVRAEADAVATVMGAITSAIADIDAEQARIGSAITQSGGSIDRVARAIDAIAGGVRASSETLSAARAEMNGLIHSGERLVGACARLGVDTVDSPYIAAVQETAQRISTALEAEVTAGRIRLDQLFDQRYQPIPDTNPAQLLAPFTALTDRVLPHFQEPMLALPRVVFCAAVDRNGYLPTHNARFSHPQRPDDVAWNTAHCRNRRIFADRVGLEAGQNQNPFLMQAYRRDMGDGRFVMMKDVSAPIHVMGRHWGGLRLAYTA